MEAGSDIPAELLLSGALNWLVILAVLVGVFFLIKTLRKSRGGRIALIVMAIILGLIVLVAGYFYYLLGQTNWSL